MQFNLTGFTPEAPQESSNDAFKYEGLVNVLEAGMKVGEKESTYYGTAAGTEFLSITLEVPADAEANAKRRLFKKFHLNSDVKDNKGKTQAEKLADWVSEAGIIIMTEDDIPRLIERLNGGGISAKMWFFPMTNKVNGKDVTKDVQMSKLLESSEVASSGY